MCPAPAWDAAYCQSQGWNQTPLNYRSACCGMLQNPLQQAPQTGAAACCGMPQPLVLGCDEECALRTVRDHRAPRVWLFPAAEAP